MFRFENYLVINESHLWISVLYQENENNGQYIVITPGSDLMKHLFL